MWCFRFLCLGEGRTVGDSPATREPAASRPLAAWCVQRGSAEAGAWGQSCRRRWATSSMLNWSWLDRHLSFVFHLLALIWHSWSQGSRKSGITHCGETALDQCHVHCKDNVFVLCTVLVECSSFGKNCHSLEEGLFSSLCASGTCCHGDSEARHIF